MWDVTFYHAKIFSIHDWFLLTHPVWDVTQKEPIRNTRGRNFYSHIPCGMWRHVSPSRSLSRQFLLTHPVWDVTRFWQLDEQKPFISTHTSRVGCDLCQNGAQQSRLKFLLTHPVWDVTRLLEYICIGIQNFYSHIPCGMWHGTINVFKVQNYFYSHIPCGMWPVGTTETIPEVSFLLTHPVWDVTSNQMALTRAFLISTHTSRVGCDDVLRAVVTCFQLNFYSHIPCGMWLKPLFLMSYTSLISTHTSRVGCDRLVNSVHP